MSTFFAKTKEALRARLAEEKAALGLGTAAAGDKNVSVALYLAAAIVQIAGLSAVAYQLAEPGFAYFTMTVTLVGLASSYYLRRLGASPGLIKSGAVLLGLLFLYALRGSGIFGIIIPYEARGSQEMLLVSALAFTATFCSFLLLTDDAVVFTCVWAIALIGLTGTVNINRELIMCFVVFMGGAVFLLVHQNYLQNRLGAEEGAAASSAGGDGVKTRLPLPRLLPVEGPTPRQIQFALMRTQAAMALTCGVAAIVVGFLIAIPMQMVGRNLSLGTIIQRLNVPAAATQRGPSSPRLAFDSPNQFDVGLGPVADDMNEVMFVFGDKPFYWRGRTFKTYTGQSWTNEDDFGDRPPLEPESPNAQPGVFKIPAPSLPRNATRRYTHKFHILSGSFAPMYHPAEPRVVRAPIYRLFVRPDNTMATRQAYGYDYEVESDIAEPTPDQLRRSTREYPVEIKTQYLYRNVGESERLRQIAAEVIGAIRNPYDRAEAIRKFVAGRCTYTLDARAVPRGRDAAVFFLDESQEGYCDLYATATTILCRYAGLPARLVTGFAPGVPDVENPKKFRLRGADRHAWTEVYFAGYGWVPFDATQDTSGVFAAPREPEKKAEWPWWQRLRDAGTAPLALGGLGVLGLLYVLANEAGGRFGRRRGTATGRADASHAGDVMRVYQGAARYIARKRGVRRAPTTTPKEYGAFVRSRIGNATGDALLPLTRLAEQALYGPESVTEADVKAAKTAFNDVRAALRADRKTEKTKENTADAPPTR